MYAEDLTSYSRRWGDEFSSVRMVGWLDEHHAYTRGSVSSNLRAKLLRILFTDYPDHNYHVNKVRSQTPCPFCERKITIEDKDGRTTPLGMSELWIPSESVWYSFPSLLLHYIEQHQYVPPKVFLEAVESCNLDEKVYSETVRNRLVDENALRSARGKPSYDIVKKSIEISRLAEKQEEHRRWKSYNPEQLE